MHRTTWYSALAALWLAWPGIATAVEFFVAPQGHDSDPGSRERPFATLQRAREAVRQAAKDGPRGVTVRAGTYALAESFVLGAEDSGSEAHPVVWRAAQGEEVRFSGGLTIPGASLRPVGDEKTLARLDAAARGEVREADLHALGVKLPERLPKRYRGAPPVPELFCNDQRMPLAGWPNEGWTTIAKIVEAGSNPRSGDKSKRPGVFEYAGDRPERWDVTSGVWLQGYWCFDWYDEVIQVQAIDRERRQITLAEPHFYSLKQGNPSPRRYRALNLLEELDRPGEYFIDAARGRLYFWPPAGAGDARIVLTRLEKPVLTLRDVEHVVLRGLTIEAGQGEGIEVTGGRDVRIEACRVRNICRMGIQVTGGSRHRVEACDIYDTGTGGLTMVGGDRRTLTAGGHEAINNHIWRFALHQLTYACGIRLGGVGCRAAHNRLHDAPHMAVGVSGNDHVFELNVVHHVCTESDDAAAYYKGRNPSCRGNVVRHNFWHHIGSPMGHGNAAVYFDDGDGGDLVTGNVFFRCGDPGKGSFGTVFSHGGHDNRAENNIFIECRRALGSSPWNDKRWKAALEGADWQTKLLKEVDIARPPFTTHYPALAGFMQPTPGQARHNHAARNVFVMCGAVSSGNWQWQPDENWVTDEDPGFVDAGRGDFRLRADAEVYKELPGFKPIPLERMGLVDSPLRPKPATESWNYAPPKRAEPPVRKAIAAAAGKVNLTTIRQQVLAYVEAQRLADRPFGAYRDRPGLAEPSLYASCDVAHLRTIMGEDLQRCLTSRQRREWIAHLNSFARPDGSYGPGRKNHSPQHANGMVIGALGALGGKQVYPVRLYEEFNTVDKVGPWLERLDWHKQWSGSHLFWGGMHCFSMSARCSGAWRTAVFDWLDANLDAETGWWRRGVVPAKPIEPLGGGAHIWPIYQHHGRRFPYPERLLDSILALQKPEGDWLRFGNYLDLDALYGLCYLRTLAPDYRREAIRAAVARHGRGLSAQWPEFMAREPDLHMLLGAVGAWGLLNQLSPSTYVDTVSWSDIFSDRRLYQTSAVEVFSTSAADQSGEMKTPAP